MQVLDDINFNWFDNCDSWYEGSKQHYMLLCHVSRVHLELTPCIMSCRPCENSGQNQNNAYTSWESGAQAGQGTATYQAGWQQPPEGTGQVRNGYHEMCRIGSFPMPEIS